jgi:hypothetical protein
MWADPEVSTTKATAVQTENTAKEYWFQKCKQFPAMFCIIIIIIIITNAIELSLGGSSPYTSTDKTNENKYT